MTPLIVMVMTVVAVPPFLSSIVTSYFWVSVSFLPSESSTLSGTLGVQPTRSVASIDRAEGQRAEVVAAKRLERRLVRVDLVDVRERNRARLSVREVEFSLMWPSASSVTEPTCAFDVIRGASFVPTIVIVTVVVVLLPAQSLIWIV